MYDRLYKDAARKQAKIAKAAEVQSGIEKSN
jgi:hypothetical protein